jgi:hypothetical protein
VENGFTGGKKKKNPQSIQKLKKANMKAKLKAI